MSGPGPPCRLQGRLDPQGGKGWASPRVRADGQEATDGQEAELRGNCSTSSGGDTGAGVPGGACRAGRAVLEGSRLPGPGPRAVEGGTCWEAPGSILEASEARPAHGQGSYSRPQGGSRAILQGEGQRCPPPAPLGGFLALDEVGIVSRGAATLSPGQPRPSRGQRGSRSSLLPQGRGLRGSPLLQLVLFRQVRPDPCLVWPWSGGRVGSGGLSPRGLLVSRSCGSPGTAPLGFSSLASLSLHRMSRPGSPPPGVSPQPPPFLYHILPWSPSAALVPGLEEGLAAGAQGPACIPASPSLDSGAPRAPVPPSSAVLGPLCPSHRPGHDEQAGFAAMAAQGGQVRQPRPVAAAR